MATRDQDRSRDLRTLVWIVAIIDVAIFALTGAEAQWKPELYFHVLIYVLNRPGFLWALVAGGLVLILESLSAPRPRLRYSVALWNLAGALFLMKTLPWSAPLMALWVVSLVGTAGALVGVPFLKPNQPVQPTAASGRG